MNQLQPYEIRIADKLQALPIPDMADMIWARIEAQLDIDLPTDDSDDDPDNPDTGPVPPGKILTGLGLSALVIALITFFYQNQSQPATNTIIPVNTVPPSIIPEPHSNSQNHSPPGSSEPSSNQPQLRNRERSVSEAEDIDSTREVVPGRTVPRFALDSSLRVSAPLIKSPPIIIPPPAKDTVARPRGIQGITDDDYRIAPKKDSS